MRGALGHRLIGSSGDWVNSPTDRAVLIFFSGRLSWERCWLSVSKPLDTSTVFCSLTYPRPQTVLYLNHWKFFTPK